MKDHIELNDLFGEKSMEQKILEMVSRLKGYRKRMHLTQAELSDRSGVPYGTVKLFERTGKISLGSLWRICIALECEDQLESLFTIPKLTAEDIRNGK